MPTLEWIGKSKVVNHHQEVPFRVLERQYSFDEMGKHTEDNGSDNMIIHGDNLEALKALLPQYEGRVKCIYIDPPYNTGNEKWCYNDNVNDPHIQKWLGEVVGKEGEDLTRHDKWLCMMYPRLMLLQKLLADDGFIFVSIDVFEYAYLRCIMDEIFGSANFRNCIAVRRGIKNVQAQFDEVQSLSLGHEYIYLYSKNPQAKLPKLSKGFEADKAGKWDTFWRGTDRPTMRYEIFGITPESGQWRWEIGRATKAMQNYENYLSNYAASMSIDDFYIDHLMATNLNSAKRYWGETTGYTSEVEHQKLRLESIGLFEKLDFNPGECPLCSGKLTQPLPSVEMIKKSITALDKSIESVTREQPKLRTFISKLENDEQQKQEEIKRLKTEIDSLYQQEDEKEKLRDLNVRRGKVIGRISLWLESVQNDATSEAQEQHIKKIEERLNEIDGALNRDSVEERKQSALSRIQQYMTKWAEELQLEHSDSPYRLDLNKMTVVVDKSDRPVPLKQLGSGSNWVGVHLITYFALQYYFIESNRPVPRFLFLDQPSQVYFPSELDEQKIDEDEVNKMYKFIIDRTEELHGQLQVIVVDHTAGEEDQSHQFVTESWWKDDKKLIPDDWYEPNEALIPVS